MKNEKVVKVEVDKKPVTKKIKKPTKTSTVAQINASQRSAVDAVKPNASKTVRGSSGLANTGTIISYD